MIVSALCQPDAVQALCDRIKFTFGESIRSLYNEEDWNRGYIISQNRHGFTENFPIATLSIAVVTNCGKTFAGMAISGMLYTEERAEAMDLSDIYVTDETNVQTFIVPKDKVNDYTQLSDFDGKRIAYQMGTVQQELVNNQLKNPVTSEFSSVQDAVLALQSGKCDAVAIAYQVGLPMVEANKDLVISDVNFIYDKNGLVVACKKGESDLVAAINVIIADEISKGLYTDWTTAAQARVKELGL